MLNDVIKPRKFSALLYSLMIGSDPDSYAFWHSSQISQSGLNLASYSNEKVDKLLEDARLTNDLNVRIQKYGEFQKIISDDLPVIFLYSPLYIYPQNKRIKGVETFNISAPSLRFANITQWYIKAAKKIVW
jgi:peptide/nickel transport system substrate-binding protein